MALSFTSSTHNIRNASAPGVTADGTVFIRVKPNWNHNDGVYHAFWQYGTTIETNQPGFVKYNDNNVYIGWQGGSNGDVRIAIAATSAMFTSGTWASHLYTWSDSANLQYYYVDNVQKGSQTGSFVADVTAGVNIGNIRSTEVQANCNSELAEYGRWNRVLDAAERAILQATGTPRSVPRGLVAYNAMWGKFTAEPGWSNSYDLTIASGVAAAAHPPVIYPRRLFARAVSAAAPPAGNRRRRFLIASS